MSEKLYALLLRLYPARFRNAYSQDALQLFRDRLRDEPGVLRRLRLWIDVLADVAASAPREHRRAVAAAVPVPAEAHLFQVLEMEPPRPATFFFGGALALAGVAAFIFLLTYAGERRPFRGQSSAASQFTSAQSAGASSSSTQLSAGGEAQSSAASSGGTEPKPSAQGPQAVFLLDAAERRRVIEAMIQHLQQYEDNREAARHIAAVLLRSERGGRFDAITSGRAFADVLNQQMHSASPATRVLVFYTNVPFTSISPSSTTHRIDDHFAISIPIARSDPRATALPKGAHFS